MKSIMKYAMKRILFIIALALVLSVGVWMSFAPSHIADAAEPESKIPSSQPSSGEKKPAAPASKPSAKVLKFKSLTADIRKRRIVIDANLSIRKGMLEFFLCKGGTKAHESLLTTEAEGVHLHFALLAMGLRPGKPAQWIPAVDDFFPGQAIPPRGAKLKIKIRWTDAAGALHEVPAGTMLSSAGGKKTTTPEDWVFVGSDVLPSGQYLADINGELISVANFASAVIDVPFESTKKKGMESFVVNTDALPAEGVENVQVIIEPAKDAQKTPHARSTLEIDRWGRMWIDNTPIKMEQLTGWANEFTDKYSRGQVVIRIDGRAAPWFGNLAEGRLRIGGVRSFSDQTIPPTMDLLPQTPNQAAVAMEEFNDRFKNPKDYIADPAERARQVLKHIREEVRELERRKELLGEYEMALKASLQRYEEGKSEKPE